MKKKVIVLILAFLFFMIGLISFVLGIIYYVNDIQSKGENFPFDIICLPFLGFSFLAFLMLIIFIKLNKK